MAGLRAAARFAPAPVDLMPYFLRFLIVSRMPRAPASPMWLLPIDTTSKPACLSPAMSFGSAEKVVPSVW